MILYARAAELAGCGKFLLAEGLLAPDGNLPQGVRELDLLARIAAQQRRYHRAAQLWDTALSLSPGDARYIRALELAKSAADLQETHRRRCRVVLLLLGAALFALAGWKLYVRLSSYEAGMEEEGTQPPVAVPPPQTVPPASQNTGDPSP